MLQFVMSLLKNGHEQILIAHPEVISVIKYKEKCSRKGLCGSVHEAQLLVIIFQGLFTLIFCNAFLSDMKMRVKNANPPLSLLAR